VGLSPTNAMAQENTPGDSHPQGVCNGDLDPRGHVLLFDIQGERTELKRHSTLTSPFEGGDFFTSSDGPQWRLLVGVQFHRTGSGFLSSLSFSAVCPQFPVLSRRE
jgi:hypothetical protein